MLVEFRIKNFRSLRDEQVLSLVASTDKTLADTNALDTGLKAAPRLLKSAVVYGANLWPPLAPLLFLVAATASVAYVAATMRFAVARDDASARGLLMVSLASLAAILVAAVACGGPTS